MHALASKRLLRTLTLFVAALAIAGCGKGDGPQPIAGTPATPLPPIPPGFCDTINFETLCALPGIENFNGGATIVIDNPDISAGNGSEKVAQMQKFADEVFGGTKLNLSEAIDFSQGEFYKVNVWSPRPVPVSFKLEETGNPGGGLTVNVNHTGGSMWQELCFDFSGQAVPPPVVALTIIFDLGVLGQAAADPDNWTFFYDDIEQVSSCSGSGGGGMPIDPDAALYSTSGDPDLVIPDDYAELTAFDSGSVIDPFYAEDGAYSPVLAVASGTGYGANIAQIGYIGFPAGFAGAYETLDFKVKGMPNQVIFVKLFDGVDTLRLNLTSSAYSDALADGWYQLSIPFADFTGADQATGVVFESDNTAAMQFTALFTDIGFSGDGGGGPPPVGDHGPGTASVFTETTTESAITVTSITNSIDFGGNNTVADPNSMAIPAFEGNVSLAIDYQDSGSTYGGAVLNFGGVDLTSYDTLNFTVDTSGMADFADLTLQIEPPGAGAAGTNVLLSSYTPVATTGNWATYAVPLADFTASDFSAAANLGFWNPKNGSDALTFGTLYVDDVYFSTEGGGPPPVDDHGPGTASVFTETTTESAITVSSITNSIDFGGNNTVADPNSMTIPAFEGDVSLAIDYQDSASTFGGAVLNFGGVDLTSYTTLNFTVDTSGLAGFADLTIQIEPPGAGAAGTNVLLSSYTPVATTGNWATYAVPLADFTATDFSAAANLGFWNPKNGSDALTFGLLYVDDVYFSTEGGDGALVPDGGFEAAGVSGLQPPWFVFENGGTVSVSNANNNGGTYAARLQADASSGAASFPILKVERLGEGTFTGGEAVTISFDAIDVDATGIGKVFVAEFFTERADPPGGATNEVILGGYGLSGAWQTYTFNTNLGADAAGGVSLLFKADCGANPVCTMDVFIDNVSIVAQ